MSRPAPDPDATASAARAMVERQQALLARLADMGMEIAEAACRRACAAETGADAEGPTLSYTRAARAVRLTLAMQQRLAKQAEELDKADHLARFGEAHRRRRLIQREVERVAEQTAAEHDIEALSSEVRERLTEEDDEALLDRPFEEVLAQICKDLGLLAPPPLGEGDQTKFGGGGCRARGWTQEAGAPCSALPRPPGGTSPRGGRASRAHKPPWSPPGSP